MTQVGGEYGAIAGGILGAITPAIHVLVKKAAKDDFIDSMEWLVDSSFLSSNFARGSATKTEKFSFKGDRNAHHVLTVEVSRAS